MKKILITGVSGMLGQEIYNYFLENCIILGLSRTNKFNNLYWQYCNLTNYKQIRKIILSFQPDIIFHCAAWTNVNEADNPIYKKKVYKINVLATKNIAIAANKINAKLVYFSTDYVFDGKKKEYTPTDKVNPLNYYGYTKWLGEKMIQKYCKQHFICRISWLYGQYGANFISNISKLLQQNLPINMVSDQVGRLTYTYDLINSLSKLVETNYFGIWHYSNSGDLINRYELVCWLKTYLHSNSMITPTQTSQEKIKRPLNSGFCLKPLQDYGLELPSWEESLKIFLTHL